MRSVCNRVSECLATSPLRLQNTAGTIKAYFRGNGVNVVKIAPETALRLTLNDRIKAVVAKNHLERITPIERMACGGLAGASAQVTIICYCIHIPSTFGALVFWECDNHPSSIRTSAHGKGRLCLLQSRLTAFSSVPACASCHFVICAEHHILMSAW